MKASYSNFKVAALGSAFALGGLAANAGETAPKEPVTPPVVEEDPFTFCDVFDMNTLYKGDGFIKAIKIHGRYQGQYFIQDEDLGNTNNDYEQFQHRRARLGLEIKMDHGLKFSMENNMADNEQIFADSWQNDWQDFYLEWEPNDDFSITLGKQKQHFTIEDTESSKRIKTVERSAIVNETAGARPWGLVVGYNVAGFENAFGAWLTGADDTWGSWPSFDSNLSLSYNLTYEIVEGTDLRLDYVFNDNDGGNAPVEGSAPESYASAYEHAVAIGTESEWGDFGLVTNAIFAWNREGSGGLPDGHDTWGLVVMPHYNVTDKLQLVARYAYMSEGREQRPQRYPVRVAVSNYHTVYAGVQYFICGDKLKLMGGYEYATGDVFDNSDSIDTGSWQLAVRNYF